MTIQNMIDNGYSYRHISLNGGLVFPMHFEIEKRAEDHPSKLNASYSFSVYEKNGQYRFQCNIGNGDVCKEDMEWLALRYNIILPKSDDFSII